MADEKKALAYKGFVIDRGIPFDGLWKAVDFFDGVGILDYEALAVTRPEWFERNAKGELVGINSNAVSIQAFIDYWTREGAKVTEITEVEAIEIKAALAAGTPIDAKYLKPMVDTRRVAARAAVPDAEPAGPAEDSAPKSAPAGRTKRGVK